MIGIISAVLCAVTTVTIWIAMQNRANGSQSYRSSFLIPWTLAIISMAIFVYSRMFATGSVNFEFYNSLLVASFVITVMLFFACLIKSVEHLGLIVLPVALACLALNLLFFDAGSSVSLDSGIQAHIITSIIAFSVLCLAAVQAILLFFQERVLKQHSNTGILRALPSMHENETMLFQSISFGVIILTAVLITGFIYLDDIFAQHLVHKTTLSTLAWIVFVILLWGRMQFGWRGATAIRWSLAGFTFLILAYFGSKFVLELVLYNA